MMDSGALSGDGLMMASYSEAICVCLINVSRRRRHATASPPSEC